MQTLNVIYLKNSLSKREQRDVEQFPFEVGEYNLKTHPEISFKIKKINGPKVEVISLGHSFILNLALGTYVTLSINKNTEVIFSVDGKYERQTVKRLKLINAVIDVNCEYTVGDTYGQYGPYQDHFQIKAQENERVKPHEAIFVVEKIVSIDEVIIYVGGKEYTLNLNKVVEASNGGSYGYNDSFTAFDEKYQLTYKKLDENQPIELVEFEELEDVL